MKCENCNHNEMLCVDDGRFENESGFDSYMCPVCLTECYIELLSNKMVTKNWSFRQQYLIRNEEIVVLSRGLDLVNILSTTIEDAPIHYKRTARVLSHEDIYKQLAKGKTIGVSYDSGVLTYYREDVMSRFYVIKGEEK